MSKSYVVTIPIAGHAVVYVNANNAEEAIEAAMSSDQLTIKSIESWEAIERFLEGNVCYCPQPWEAEAECQDEEEGQ